MICETVLRCSPDCRASSAREIGCRVRISSSTMSRLMRRAVPLEASSTSDRSTRRISRARCRFFFIVVVPALPDRSVRSVAPHPHGPWNEHLARSTPSEATVNWDRLGHTPGVDERSRYDASNRDDPPPRAGLSAPDQPGLASLEPARLATPTRHGLEDHGAAQRTACLPQPRRHSGFLPQHWIAVWAIRGGQRNPVDGHRRAVAGATTAVAVENVKSHPQRILDVGGQDSRSSGIGDAVFRDSRRIELRIGHPAVAAGPGSCGNRG